MHDNSKGQLVLALTAALFDPLWGPGRAGAQEADLIYDDDAPGGSCSCRLAGGATSGSLLAMLGLVAAGLWVTWRRRR